jgi:hypothetical protein
MEYHIYDFAVSQMDTSDESKTILEIFDSKFGYVLSEFECEGQYFNKVYFPKGNYIALYLIADDLLSTQIDMVHQVISEKLS